MPVSTPEKPETYHKRPAASRWLQSLVAVLIVGLLIGSFVTLISLEQNALSHGHATPTPVQTNGPAIITFSTKDGSIYAVKAEQSTVAWHYTTHKDISQMTQLNGRLYVATSGPAVTDRSQVFAFDLVNGELLWQKMVPLQSGGFTVIAVDDETIAVSSEDALSVVYVLDAHTGNVLWHFQPSPTDLLPRDMILGLHNHVLYLRGKEISAYQASSGKLLWTASSPSLESTDLLAFHEDSIYAFNLFSRAAIITRIQASNGKVLRVTNLPSDEAPILNSVNEQGTMYTTKWTATSNGMMISTAFCKHNYESNTLLWCSPKVTNPVINGCDTTCRDFYSQAIIVHDKLFYYQALSNDNPSQETVEAYGFNLVTGARLWTWNTSDQNLYDASNLIYLTGAEGILYATTQKGIYVIRASDGHQLAHILSNLNITSFATPSAPGQNYVLPS